MAGVIAGPIRELVFRRAAWRCEYCLLHQEDVFTPHQIDHIVSRKHGGDSSPENLALACVRCNSWKGTDIAGWGFARQEVTFLYHPRVDRWGDHSRLEADGAITALTDAGVATVRLLKLNIRSRILERLALMECGRYPR